MKFGHINRPEAAMDTVKIISRSGKQHCWMPWGWSLLAHAVFLGGAWWLISTAHHATPRGIHPVFIPTTIAAAPGTPVHQATPPSPRRGRAVEPPAAGLPAWSQRPPEAIRSADVRGGSQAAVLDATSSIPLQGDSDAPPPAFPLPRQPPAASVSSVFSDTGRAATVAYVCDASGSMSADRLRPLKSELRRAVAALRPIQAFTIIFFKQDQAESLSRGLIMANDGNKRRAETFLEGVQSGGTTDPVAGLNQAFDARPAVIYLLTDGDFPDAAAVLSCIARRNPQRSVTINTIAFLGSGTQYEAILRRIAGENGGTFRRVTREELRNAAAKGLSDEATKAKE
jgi:Mg-chelatase subunit ChlD